MELLTLRELHNDPKAFAGKTVTLGGWVRNLRTSKNFGFIMLSDGTCFQPVQVVYGDKLANFTEISKTNIGAALIVKGEVVLTPDARQSFEVQAAEIAVEGPSTPDYPVQPKRHTMEYLRTITHLRPRTNTFQAVFRVRSLIA
ncbi:MAG: OB-fold nucleic acid binding domain-containing protein, partial [Oscillospiraceae bacterium]|nr:OB-fold nucleic acid binding domain-containing protein [Oscillospiraceae bacterium]